MPKYSRKKIKAFFAKADNAKTQFEKGKCLEDLAVYLFELVPGIVRVERDRLNVYDTEEIDLALYNKGEAKGFAELTFLILVECKNWSKPVGSEEVSWFIDKLRTRGLDFGILIAAQGITGDAANKKQAHSIVSKALMEKIRIVLFSRGEIESLKDTDELVALVQRKLCELIVSGTVWP